MVNLHIHVHVLIDNVLDNMSKYIVSPVKKSLCSRVNKIIVP